MNNKNNYKEQDIKCCLTCNHSLKGYGFVCALIALECKALEDQVNYLGVCDKYERKSISKRD